MNEKILTIGVSDIKEARQRMKSAFRGKAEATARYSFATRESLLRTLNHNRWNLIEALTGAGPIALRELARRAGRDVKAVHTDVQTLVSCGLVDKADDGKLHFPYDAVHVDFMLKAA